jgi:5-(carboxyamino)imidazole ribonucleotide mutase
VRILAAADPALQERMTGFQAQLSAVAHAKGEALRANTGH